MKIGLLLLLATAGLTPAADTSLSLPNGNFEQGLEGWTAEPPDAPVEVASEAALLGAKGLRVHAAEPTRFALVSEPIPVTPGRTYTVSFWAGGNADATAGGLDVKMVFKDPAGNELAPDMARIRKWPGVIVKSSRFPHNPLLAAAAPEGAETLSIRIASAGREAVGPLHVDDFQIRELSLEAPTPVPAGQANPIPPSDPARLKELEAEVQANPNRGKSPPKIVIKLDDFGSHRGRVHPRWQQVADFARAKNIKVTFGIIGKKMDEENPEFVQWVKDQHAAGRIEFWHHGWDHAERTENGKRIMEFAGEPLEHQRDHLAKTQKLAREKFGFAFTTFGAPFNATDENTVQALADDPDLKVWLYGDPARPAGKVVLERSAVTIETPTMIPNYGAFLEAYAHSRGAEYFVLQGHPAGWNDERWEQFGKIVDFLIAQKAEFVLASDFAK